jgi:hypothetical protein
MKKHTLNVMFSKKSDNWATPKIIYDEFMKQNYFDPCPLFSAKNNLNELFDFEKMFINPPYSDIFNWVKFAIKHINYKTNKIIMLVPARTDTKWFHLALENGGKVTFIKGRLRFNDSNPAPFPSIYITFQK